MEHLIFYITSVSSVLFLALYIRSRHKAKKYLAQNQELQKSLQHSQKMQAIGQLSSAIAHDFNNLLTAMIGFCDIILLRHSPKDESYSELMQIKQNAYRAANLVRQLLAFSKNQTLLPKILDVSEVIAELSTLLTRLLGQNITLTIQHGADLDLINVDQGQLEQVIINLAVNARDAMNHNGNLYIKTSNIMIDDSFREDEYYTPPGDDPIEHGNYLLIEMEDSGCGISHAILDKIFEPFFSTKDINLGTGIGLATVHDVMKHAGGYIRLRTNPGKGTIFSIFLKAYTDAAPKMQVHMKDELMEKLLIKDYNYKGKILVVEDEISVRLFTTCALTSKGYEVIEAESAEKAMSLLEADSTGVDLVITDVMMPGMTGTEMADKIAKNNPHMKFIFTSGYAEDSLSYLSGGKHHFLSKPFSIKELATKVKEVISE